MKKKSFSEMYDYDICELKNMLYEVARHYQDEALCLALLYSVSLDEIQTKIRAKERFRREIFYYGKHCIDQAEHLGQTEKILVWMNLVLGRRYRLYETYKNELYKTIMANVTDYLTTDEYCVIRHLLKFNRFTRRHFLNQIRAMLDGIEDVQDVFDLEIYLLECDYQKAWDYIEKGIHASFVRDYHFELAENNPRLYRAAFQTQQPGWLDRFKERKEQFICMKKQLKY